MSMFQKKSMPISLTRNQRRLLSRLKTLDSAFDRHIVLRSFRRRIDRASLQEGLISTLWQSWCAYCRSTLVGSVQGAMTKNGVLTTSVYSQRSESEITFVAKQFAQGNNVNTIRALSGSHLEPTWGDPSKLNLMILGLQPSNHGTLITAFSACSSLNDLQMCRNANAHLNIDRLIDVNLARVRYLQTDYAHPSDVMQWIDPATNDYLWKSWIDEMMLISSISVQ